MELIPNIIPPEIIKTSILSGLIGSSVELIIFIVIQVLEFGDGNKFIAFFFVAGLIPMLFLTGMIIFFLVFYFNYNKPEKVNKIKVATRLALFGSFPIALMSPIITIVLGLDLSKKEIVVIYYWVIISILAFTIFFFFLNLRSAQNKKRINQNT
jgi:hypothetical protein